MSYSLAIVGGGIGGLCLAAALVRKNVPIHVYEAAPAFTEIGAGVGLSPNALRAMALMDPVIMEAYRRCSTTNDTRPSEQGRFFNFRYGMDKPSADGWKAGDLICEVRHDSVTSSVHRARFLGELVSLIPPEKATCGKRLIGFEDVAEGVSLKFADGTEAWHDAVIGCDGIKSQVRKMLLKETDGAREAVFSGKYCYRGLVPAPQAIEILGEDMALDSQMYLGDHGHVLTTAIEQGKIINVVAYHTKEDGHWDHEAWIKPATKEEMYAEFDGWSQPVRDVLSLVGKPDMWALFDHLPIPTYHYSGKICLLGDSAHASTPHHGAGAGMAIEDAFVLSNLLSSAKGKHNLEGTFAAYDAVRRPRSQRLVDSSRKVAEVYDFEDKDIGHDMKATGRYLERAWDWIWDADLDEQLQQAQELQLSYHQGAASEIKSSL